MNCEEVNTHLIDYLDKTLDTAMTTRVATHLISCPPCGAEASELADCMHQVAALPAMDPPLGFAQRVMAHVRELEAKPTLWQRMFLPWTQKLPLQAAALVMVGITGIVLYQKDEQLERTELKNMTLAAALDPANPSDESRPRDIRQADKKKEPALRAPAALAKPAKPVVEKKQLSSPASQLSQSGKREAEVRSEEPKISRRAPIQVQEASTMRDVGRFSGETSLVPPMPLGGLRPNTPRSGTLALDRLVPLGERVADYEFVVRRRPPPRRDLENAASKDPGAHSLEADFATPPAAPATINPRIESIAEIRFYSVAPEHYEFFRKELASEAIIEAESTLADKEREIAPFDRQLLIKVTILPPVSPQPAGAPR